jgi:hypothetical protein
MNPCELMACPCTTSTPNALKKSFWFVQFDMIKNAT